MLIWLAFMAGLTCPVGTALVNPSLPPSTENCAWVPAATGEPCGMDAHRHVLDLDGHGHYVVNHEKGEPDIVFDGLCHDNNDEHVIDPPERKKLPVPKPYNSEDI